MASSSTLKGSGRKRAVAPGRGQCRWNNSLRLTLHLLYTAGYEIPSIGAIFNRIFKAHLEQCGLPDGLALPAIVSQYRERWKKPKPPAHWDGVLLPTAEGSEEASRRALIKEQIERTARSLGAAAPTLEGSQPSQLEELTPVQGKRRSQAVVEDDDLESDAEYTPAARPKRTRTVRSEPQVVIPVTPRKRGRPPKATTASSALMTPPRTPTPRKSRLSRAGPKIFYENSLNGGIWLDHDRHARTEGDYDPVPEQRARPVLPTLLFRLWHDDAELEAGKGSVSPAPRSTVIKKKRDEIDICQSRLEERGFTASRFRYDHDRFIDKVPALENTPWGDIRRHMNRTKVDSSFISTTDELFWVVHLALREAEKGHQNGYITIMDASLLDRETLFHAQRFHDSLSRKACFENCAQMYHGMREWLVWSRIPKEAILHTFPVQQLIDLTRANPEAAAILRTQQIQNLPTGKQKVKAFKAQGGVVTPTVIGRIVKDILGMDADTRLALIAHAVADVVSGFGLKIGDEPQEGWQKSATDFARVMFEDSSGLPDLQKVQSVRFAFLEGLQHSFGTDGWRTNELKSSPILGRAKQAGLESISTILRDEQNAMALRMEAYEEQQKLLLKRTTSRWLLLKAPATGEDDDMDDEIDDVAEDEEDEEEILFECDDLELRQ